jgi:hypothetical protein
MTSQRQRSDVYKPDPRGGSGSRCRRRRGRFAATFASAWLLWLVVVSSALAGQATHEPLPALDLNGSNAPAHEFNRACGVATDSEGDVYVSSAGTKTIDVFGPNHEFLTAISDSEEPCGVAVDGEGVLYVLEMKTGHVVEYKPDIYPFAGTPIYGLPTTIDSSGEAKGVAVDPANNHLFVNTGTKVIERKSAGEGSAVVNASVGEGVLSHGYGVGVWGATGEIYASDESGKVYVFDPTGATVLATIDGTGRPGGAYGALPKANIAVNQSNGHVLVADIAEAGTVDEFESTGPYVSQTTGSFADAGPSAVAVDASKGASAGRIYVTSGPGAGAEVFAFAPLSTPTHRQLPNLEPEGSETTAKEFKNNEGVTVDSEGDVYVDSNGTSSIDVFAPEGAGFRFLTAISDTHIPEYLAVDSKGNVYVGQPNAEGEHKGVFEYPITSPYPFAGGTPTYGSPVKIDTMVAGENPAGGIAINPANDHLFVAHAFEIREYDSAADGSALLRSGIGAALAGGGFEGIAVYGQAGKLFAFSHAEGVFVIDLASGEKLAQITGEGISANPDGKLPFNANVAVDQSNGHVYVMNEGGGNVYEFESSGAYVTTIQRSIPEKALSDFGAQVAVDGSDGQRAGDLFVTYGFNGPPAVNAYAPAEYGEPPLPITGAVSSVNGPEGRATLEGTVNPNGAAIESCRFEYVTEEAIESNGFAVAATSSCAESQAEIGSGFSAVAVHAEVSGLSAASRYYYRLSVSGQSGESHGEARKLGAPEVTVESASETLYTETMLDATIDPLQLAGSYRCEYGLSSAYGSVTAETAIGSQPGEQARCPLSGLQQGVTYHYRIVATNAWGATPGSDQMFTTLTENAQSCPNADERVGSAATLPDCRAYELVTPYLNILVPFDGRSDGPGVFPGPLVSPDGEDLIYRGEGNVPGSEGDGVAAYRAHRGADGWVNTLASPTGAQAERDEAGGVTPSQEYAFWHVGAGDSLAVGNYLRLPNGSFQPIGLGQESVTDPLAYGRWISEGGTHVVFTSSVQLASGAPRAGVEGIYDRSANGLAQLVSTPPAEASEETELVFAEHNANYEGASADGSTVAFKVGSTLYVHRAGQTSTVIAGDSTFGGLSADGSKLFYIAAAGFRGEAFVYDTESGTSSAIGSGGESVLVNVSADGSHVYFASRKKLDEGAVEGKENLYLWSGFEGVSLIGVIADGDIEAGGEGSEPQRLGFWTTGIGPVQNGIVSIERDTSRTTADGQAFVFESMANLTSYDSKGHIEVYLYKPGQAVRCVSCNFESPASSGATLQAIAQGSELKKTLTPTLPLTTIPNVSEDGSTVLFETAESLVPQDTNGINDVYEWHEGAVSLLSAGTGLYPSYLFGASSDGRNVFIVTSDTLLPADIDGGQESIYDVRVDGGFPPIVEHLCEGEECRSGESTGAPNFAAPGSAGFTGPGNFTPSTTTVKSKARAKPARCPAGERLVKKKGKKRCVAKRAKRAKHVKKAAGHDRGRRG